MATLFVASNGGHLAQLHRLAQRMAGVSADRLWVTFDCEQARTLLAGERTVFVPYIAERDLLGVGRDLMHARRMMRPPHRVSAVVSTGSAIALAFLPYAAAHGIEAHYIESAARVAAPSLTGRLLQVVAGVRLYRQYHFAVRGRWLYGGSVFDGFQAGPEVPRPVRRVVVTVGSDRRFARMIEAVRAVVPAQAEVLWQTADAGDARSSAFVPAPVLEEAVRQADVVVAHAGCGSALMALGAGKCPILVPRDPGHGEVVDHHQIEIARWLDERGLAIARPPEALHADDLALAAGRSVRRLDQPPPFLLSRPI